MVEVGGMPILWHIMKIYSSYGLNDFVVCLGYKGDTIKDYFFNYSFRTLARELHRYRQRKPDRWPPEAGCAIA